MGVNCLEHDAVARVHLRQLIRVDTLLSLKAVNAVYPQHSSTKQE